MKPPAGSLSWHLRQATSVENACLPSWQRAQSVAVGRGSSVSSVPRIAAWQSRQSFAPRLACEPCEKMLVTVSCTAASSGGCGLPIAAGWQPVHAVIGGAPLPVWQPAHRACGTGFFFDSGVWHCVHATPACCLWPIAMLKSASMLYGGYGTASLPA